MADDELMYVVAYKKYSNAYYIVYQYIDSYSRDKFSNFDDMFKVWSQNADPSYEGEDSWTSKERKALKSKGWARTFSPALKTFN